MFTPVEIYALAVKIEENGGQYYQLAASKVADPALRELLHWLADQEERHRGTFMRIQTDLERNRKEEPQLMDIASDVLKEAVGSHTFSLEEADLSKVGDKVQMLEVAIGFEEDSIQFYEIIGGFISEPDSLIAIQEIRMEEVQHMRLLREKVTELQADRFRTNSGERNG